MLDETTETKPQAGDCILLRTVQNPPALFVSVVRPIPAAHNLLLGNHAEHELCLEGIAPRNILEIIHLFVKLLEMSGVSTVRVTTVHESFGEIKILAA
ncbi:MAG: hypothetical protein UW32_C0003G0110 [Candidatus Wolfebacteria bacterium GW2011_GWE2_44_13]|uniref:Uncharacterized protein n=1 Tax=Candidatus Wolfebacteria bacterium GW2011_GWE2_44_13 TaxID=1619017 RepID=A0A0G1JG48_9BACT|nr:MAG: hypothetical protein UW32_C0003G0110 [Candidatus Wolfebacteria bacterium GW2011_GWE2_44_13]